MYVTFTPAKVGCDKLLYGSSNPKVAAVTSQGRISAKARGTAVITISSHNGKTTKVTISVT